MPTTARDSNDEDGLKRWRWTSAIQVGSTARTTLHKFEKPTRGSAKPIDADDELESKRTCPILYIKQKKKMYMNIQNYKYTDFE